ncbi:hypothetical protein [Patulibacter minatonensis]|uniref:hypothetical protein n=1 Tax=Patulibacter minatonensis TaxID=298163 RepID=UPI00047A91EB|nr:hypothetical protein [Patulibacter minatonensis]
MPRTTLLRRPLSRALPIAATVGAVLLAGPAVGSASAKAKHTPCPTVGKTVAKGYGPNVRVWREGTTLKACSRSPGQKRYVRTLGVWTSGTKVVVDEGSVAYTTTSQSDEHGVVDAIDVYDVKAGKRWFSTTHTAIVPDTSAPTTDDRVLKLVLNHSGVAWVTSRGVVNLGARKLDPNDEFLDVPSLPFRVGRQIFLGDAGVAGAAGVAKGLSLSYGGESDDCGGVQTYEVNVPAFGTSAATHLTYGSQPTAIDHEGCNA